MSEDAMWDLVVKVHLTAPSLSPGGAAATGGAPRTESGGGPHHQHLERVGADGQLRPGQLLGGQGGDLGLPGHRVDGAREVQITVNALAPVALTRLTEDLGLGNASEDAKAAMDPRWIAPLCTWLASPQSNGVTGQVFEVSGGWLAVAEGWHRGPSTQPVDDPSEVDAAIRPLLAKARPGSDMFGNESRPALKS